MFKEIGKIQKKMHDYVKLQSGRIFEDSSLIYNGS